MTTETKNLKQSLIDWRRHFHRNPELSYKEYETSKYIAEVLRTFDGIEVTRPTETSVLGVLRGTKTDGPVILLRADIDALPVKEETGAEYASEKPGVMHACGHDAHAAMLLGAARELSSMRSEMDGEIRFIFQHARKTSRAAPMNLSLSVWQTGWITLSPSTCPLIMKLDIS